MLNTPECKCLDGTPIVVGGKYVTRDGREVVVRKISGTLYPVHGFILDIDELHYWCSDGNYASLGSEHALDLMGPIEAATYPDSDFINHPPHYTAHPSGIECIQITEHMGFNLGNAIKYIWRADLKGASIDDLKKARWYIDREIALREGKAS